MDSMFKQIILNIKTAKEDVKNTEKELENMTDNFTKYFQEKFVNTLENLGSKVASSFTKYFNVALDWFENQFKLAWGELQDMMRDSYLTSDTTRSNAFTYGMSPAQSYGFEQAKSMMGISESDLPFMTGHQAEKFQEIMNKYSEKYSKLYDSGFFEKVLDYQIEMQELQQDVRMEFMTWFMDNKDTIKVVFRTVLKVGEFLLDVLSKIVNLLGGRDITNYSDYNVNNSNITTNNSIKVDNTFNGVNSTDQTNLTNPGLMTYEQALSIFGR